MSDNTVRRVIVTNDQGGPQVIRDEALKPSGFGDLGGGSLTIWDAHYEAIPGSGTRLNLRVALLRIPAGDQEAWDNYVVQRFEIMADRKQPGMHRTPTIDFCYVVHGDVTLQLRGGTDVRLSAGDVVIQEATWHRWVNESDKPVTILVALSDVPAPHHEEGESA